MALWIIKLTDTLIKTFKPEKENMTEWGVSNIMALEIISQD